MSDRTLSSRMVLRGLLLASAGGVALSMAGTAQAQDGPPSGGYVDAVAPEAQDHLSAFQLTSQGHVTAVAPDPQVLVVTPPTGQPDPSLDSGITGIGQMIIDQQNGFIGLCTGTLINPRTVIFAAHCVNEEAATAYGVNSGGKPIAFGFAANNNVAGNSAFGHWLNTYSTNIGDGLYNVDQVRYNDESLALGPDNNFLQADVALATLDTAAGDVPTWALLFSALPDPGTIGASGTGYHVQIAGYGNHGYGTSGAVPIDYRRRVAENMLGALTTLENFEGFLFGGPLNGLEQNLYFLDFDDPRRGTASASPYDFNPLRDNATPLEGITSGGDSGGPLILDNTFDMAVVIGVLSGGYTRFYNGQPANSYGTVSFYQPLYLYWDWIAANNPYHYVSAKAGDGLWTDPNHWVTNIDPAYKIIDANGNLVTGVPTVPGAGTTGNDGQFGQICFQTTSLSDCYDTATGVEYFDPTGHPIGTAGDDKAVVSVAGLTGAGLSASAAGDPAPAVSALALPAATLGNGLPGASGFVPDNYYGDRESGTMARYFDVTLSAAGLTTLDTYAEVDRLTLNGGNLAITADGALWSNIEINQYQGVMNLNGDIGSYGDYLLLQGGLTGSGGVYTPYFTSIAGSIAPGTLGGIGTLTFYGDVILASGTAYYVDLGPGGTSDRINVYGAASIGGTVLFGSAGNYVIRDGDHYTILTAQGGVSGTFNSGAISAILTPHFTYTATSVLVDIEAGLYADVVSPGAPVQGAYAQLLDQNRVQYDRYADLYGTLDMMSAANVRATLDSLAPRAQNAVGLMGVAATNAMGSFFRSRIGQVSAGGTGGTLAMSGQPLQLASLAVNSMPGADPVRSDAGDGMAVADGALPDTVAVYLAGGYIDGSGAGLPVATPNGRNKFNGYFIVGGVEAAASDKVTIGFGLGYSDLDGSTVVGSDEAKGKLYQGTLYAVADLGGAKLDAQVSAGAYETKTKRLAAIGPTIYTLTANDRAFAFAAEGGIGKTLSAGALMVTPHASIRYNLIDFGKTAENGGGPALQYDLGKFEAVEGRAGLNLGGSFGALKPYVTANYVHDFQKRPGAFAANFVGGVGPAALFGLAGSDQDWGEISGGFTFGSGKVSASVGAETTIERKDVRNQTYRASISYRF